MRHVIDINESRSYTSEANLDKALKRYGLFNYSDIAPNGSEITLRYLKCRNAEGRWTAVFCVTKFINAVGGYAGIASQYGFTSI